jgi:hypothetical protein
VVISSLIITCNLQVPFGGTALEPLMVVVKVLPEAQVMELNLSLSLSTVLGANARLLIVSLESTTPAIGWLTLTTKCLSTVNCG